MVAERTRSVTQTRGDESAAQEIARIAATEGWQAAAHDYMRQRSNAAYRLAVDEYRAQLRVLLPLDAKSRVLHLRCGWGPIALGMASCVGMIAALDDRPAQLRFLAARRASAGADTMQLVRSHVTAPLPFAAEAFDAAVVIDAIGRFGAAPHALLGEFGRLLRPGGWLMLAAANRLGFARPRSGANERPWTYWGYERALRRAGFGEIRFYMALPSHEEPFFILPLDRWRLLNHFVDGLFTAQDYRFKLEARGLSAAYRLAWAIWRIGRRLRLTGLARYACPSYLIVARR